MMKESVHFTTCIEAEDDKGIKHRFHTITRNRTNVIIGAEQLGITLHWSTVYNYHKERKFRITNLDHIEVPDGFNNPMYCVVRVVEKH